MLKVRIHTQYGSGPPQMYILLRGLPKEDAQRDRRHWARELRRRDGATNETEFAMPKIYFDEHAWVN